MALSRGQSPPSPRPFLIGLDAIRHPEAGHLVQDLDCHLHFDPLAVERWASHSLTEDALGVGKGCRGPLRVEKLAIPMWQRGEGRRLERLFYSLTTVVFCTLLWQMSVWNILPWKL